VVTTVRTLVNERPSALAAACTSFAAAALPPTAHPYGVGVWAVNLALVEPIFKGRIGSVSRADGQFDEAYTSTTSSINGTTSAKGAVMGLSQRGGEARGVPPRGRPV